MGTVPYMAPEQVRAEPVDARTDLYALGCMLYEALTGQVPFSSSTPDETAKKHLYQWPLSPSELARGVPAPLERLVLQLLEKNPSDRIGHADDVAEILFDVAERIAGAGGAASGGGGPRGAHAAGYLYRPELVGRDEALAALEDAIAHAADGAGSLMVIAGESGVGKTFLAAEAGRRAQLRELRVVAGDALAIAPTDGAAAKRRDRRRPDPRASVPPVPAAAADGGRSLPRGARRHVVRPSCSASAPRSSRPTSRRWRCCAARIAARTWRRSPARRRGAARSTR